MKALISPNEKVFDPSTDVELGNRVAQTSDVVFDVAPPLFWADCSNDVIASEVYYDPVDGLIKTTPLPPPPVQPIVDGAETL